MLYDGTERGRQKKEKGGRVQKLQENEKKKKLILVAFLGHTRGFQDKKIKIRQRKGWHPQQGGVGLNRFLKDEFREIEKHRINDVSRN